MILELRVAGPGLDVRRRLAPGEPALILGRDSDCGLCLPDPRRSLSRRHLSAWNDGGTLHFHVLSVVNGVSTALSGELPPGARGVLAPGDLLALSEFRISVHPVSDTAGAGLQPPDPWTELQRMAAQLGPGQGAETRPGVEADPFDWGFHSTFGPASTRGSLRDDAAQPARDLHALFDGLGIDGPPVMTNGELEAMGRVMRIALQGLLHAVQAGPAAARTAGEEERTLPDAREFNPLRMEAPLEAKLSYLLAGDAAAAGLPSPERALAQVAAELAAHQDAVGEALLETVQKVLQECAPGAADTVHAADPTVHAHEVIERYFAPAYVSARMRAKRNTQAPS